MRLTPPMLAFLKQIKDGNERPFAADPAVPQSMRKRGYAVRLPNGSYQLTTTGEQALAESQKGKK